MAGKLKILGLTIGVVLAVSAVTASAASAKALYAEVMGTETIGTQATTNVLTTEAGKSECKEVKFTGKIEGFKTEAINTADEFGGCTAFGHESHTVSTCHHWSIFWGLFTWRQCTSGQDHKETVTGTEPPQDGCLMWLLSEASPEGSVSYANKGTGNKREVLMTFNIKETNYIVEGGGGFCGEEGEHSDGEYAGSVTFKGMSEGKQVGIWVE